MIRLHQTFGAHAGRCLERTEGRIRFGRLPDNEVAFDPHADLDASGRHAEIVREGGGYVLVDVGSRNGTYVDGRRVERLALRGGEEIEFGQGGPRIRVELPPAVRPDAGDAALLRAIGADAHDPWAASSSIETTRIHRARERADHRLLRLAIAVLIVGVAIAVVAIAVLLHPTD